MTRPKVVAALVFVVAAVGCGSTYFNVRVRDRRPSGWIEGASVALRADATCRGGALSQSETDDAGMALVEASGCGPRVLWVLADGFRPWQQELDSCDDAQRNVVLQPMPPAPQLDTPEVVAAQTFLAALDARDRDAVAQMLADPNELTQYLPDVSSGRAQPCTRRLSRVISGSEPRVEFDSNCYGGCRQLWRVVLISREGTFRVRALELVSE